MRVLFVLLAVLLGVAILSVSSYAPSSTPVEAPPDRLTWRMIGSPPVDGVGITLWRAQVEGGWLYTNPVNGGLAFVPKL